jgi:hypothetical protein
MVADHRYPLIGDSVIREPRNITIRGAIREILFPLGDAIVLPAGPTIRLVPYLAVFEELTHGFP